MTTPATWPGLDVPQRHIPVPSSISPEAQARLARGAVPPPQWPAMNDVEGWRRMIATMDQMVLEMTSPSRQHTETDFEVEEVTVDRGARVFVVTPRELDARERVYLELHGGGFTLGGGELCRQSGMTTASKYGITTWAVDYRMPPDHPFPAALDDCIDAYRALLAIRPPHHIVVGGGSAGGNLAAALAVRAKDEGLPMPAALILLTPAVDLSRAGDTYATNDGVDTVLTGRGGGADLYSHGHDVANPYLSPLFGDVAGFPPTLLASGTRDRLLSDTVRMHRKLRAAGVVADLHVLEAAPHGFFFGGTPEDEDLDREVRLFIEKYCPAPAAIG